MDAKELTRATIRKVPLLQADEQVRSAVARILDSGLPALPVVESDGRLYGIFGERELIAAVFPGYVSQLRSAAFVPQSLDEVLERRLACADEPVSKYATTEPVAVGLDHSDVQLAEIFLHHRVLIIPVTDEDGCVSGVVTRSAFFEALVRRFLERTS
jgi:CBS-domain-containing membrane protein